MTGKQNDPILCEHRNDKRFCQEGYCPTRRAMPEFTGIDMGEDGDKTVEQTFTVDDIMGSDFILPNGRGFRLPRRIGEPCKHGKPPIVCEVCVIENLHHQITDLTMATAKKDAELAKQEATIKRLRRKKRKWKQKARTLAALSIRFSDHE